TQGLVGPGNAHRGVLEHAAPALLAGPHCFLSAPPLSHLVFKLSGAGGNAPFEFVIRVAQRRLSTLPFADLVLETAVRVLELLGSASAPSASPTRSRPR